MIELATEKGCGHNAVGTWSCSSGKEHLQGPVVIKQACNHQTSDMM